MKRSRRSLPSSERGRVPSGEGSSGTGGLGWLDAWAGSWSSSSSGGGGASRLASMAGRAEVDALEPRQLLFAGGPVVIPGLPGTFSTVTIQFGYTVPYLAPTADVGDSEGETIIEDFSDEPNLNPNQGIPSGFVFDESNLRVFHNLPFAAANFAYRVTLGADGAPVDGSERIEVVFRQPGDSFSFRFSVQDNPDLFIATNSFRVDIGADVPTPLPLDTDNTLVELFFQGELVASYTGQGIRNLNTTGVGGFGSFNFVTNNVTTPFFDEIRFTRTGGDGTNRFSLDNIEYDLPSGNFADIVERRIHGARVVFTGPAGAEIEMFDLYGRPIRITTAVGRIPQADILLIDLDGDGIPDFNDGIGRIVLRNTDAASSLLLIGGLIEEVDGAFVFQLTENIVGEIDRLEGESGFGFRTELSDDGQFTVTGLPESSGSIVVGAAWDRPLSNYNPGGLPPGFSPFQPVTGGFNRADQGVFIDDGSAIGRVDIWGFLQGSSRFTGAVGTLAVGGLLGSVTFAGDVRDIIVATDAGVWRDDPGLQNLPPGVSEGVFATGSRITVGRTLVEYLVGGRSAVDITVFGDLSNPDAVPARDVSTHIERENFISIPLDADEAAVVAALAQGADLQGRFDALFGNALYRNDSILGSEFVGNAGTSVRILGQLGSANPVMSAEDLADVYAFPAEKGRQVVIQIDLARSHNVRVMDAEGRTLAALKGFDSNESTGDASRVVFEAPYTGVFYLVIGAAAAGGGIAEAPIHVPSASYEVLITGMAPVTFGSYRVAMGGNVPTGGVTNINVRNGSMGIVRVGTAVDGPDADPVDPLEYINSNVAGVNDALAFTRGAFTVAGSLYSVTSGGDIRGVGLNGIRFVVGRDVGHIVTGLSPLVGEDNDGLQGDVWGATFDVGRHIGFVNIRGAIGINQNTSPDTFISGAPLTINTGLNGGTGDIGFIRVGSRVNSAAFRVNTSPGSTVGGFVVTQDLENEFAAEGGEPGISGSNTPQQMFNLGAGSDIRFVDFPQIRIGSSIASSFPIISGEPVEFVDDAGGRVRISVTGAPAGALLGNVLILPISGTQGVAVARINVDLSGGFGLLITSLGADGDVVSIGQINITGASETSTVRIEGPNMVDVWRIRQTGGDAFNFIENVTPGGDIVAIDVVGLNRITINGNLGSTTLPDLAPRNIGPFLGIANGLQGEVGGALGVAGPAEGNLPMGLWNGETFRPIRSVPGGGAGFADDHGFPFDPYLNGAVIRSGSVELVSVNGSVGDVILQGGVGTELTSLVVNANRSTPAGEFHGIVGTIYSHLIVSVNVGDGLSAPGSSPLAEAGIFAADDIRLVVADVPGSNISGVIGAFNLNPLTLNPNGTFGVQGIDRIEVRSGGSYIGATIFASTLHAFWSPNTNVNDVRNLSGVVNFVLGENADFRNSLINGFDLNTFRMNNGDFDASTITLLGDALLIEAANFRNSSLTGTVNETRQNVIEVGRNLTTLRTINNAGDILDLDVTVIGRVLDRVSSRNMARSQINVANNVALIQTTGSIGGSEFVLGSLNRLLAGTLISGSTISVSGPVLEIRAGQSIRNVDVRITGPDGRLDLLVTPGLMTGAVSSAGPIGRIEATNNDIRLRLTTTTSRGTIGSIAAGRDLELDADISARVNDVFAGRHIGTLANPGSILLRDDLVNLTTGGQLYSDLRIGGSVTGIIGLNGFNQTVNLPGVSQLGTPSIFVSGRINTVIVIGDFGGSIVSYSGGIGRVGLVDGSLLPTALVLAEAGSIDEIRIDRGNLYGVIHADYSIRAIGVFADDQGVFGDIGVNPNRSAFAPFSATRNQLPPGVVATSEINGPRITAGHNIGGIYTSNGSMFEAFVFAGRAIGTIWINGDITADNFTSGRPSVIAAADSIFDVIVTGTLNRAYVLAGVTGFGADGRPGGVGANADSGKSGKIYSINAGAISNSVITAGVSTGADGVYGTMDDLSRPGVSFIGAINAGAVASTTVVSDAFGDALLADGRFNRFSPDMIDHPHANGPFAGVPIASGQTIEINLGAGETATVSFEGDGEAVWDQATRRVLFRGTNFSSRIIVTATGETGVLSDFGIVGLNDASAGLVRVVGDLAGTSHIYIDGYVQAVQVTGRWTGTGSLTIGEEATSVTLGAFLAGVISAPNIATLTINGAFSSEITGVQGTSAIEITSAAAININATMRGRIFTEGTVGAIRVSGLVEAARVQVGGSLGEFVAGATRNSRLAVADRMVDRIAIFGNATGTTLLFGANLGREAEFDTVSGQSNDVLRAGFADGPITVNGSFERSSIVAGALRGVSGFFNTADDEFTPGLSRIGQVTIAGTSTGSNQFTEQYAVLSTGSLGVVTVGGQTAVSSGNFSIVNARSAPEAIRVTELRVTSAANVYTATMTFNQAMNAATLAPALSVTEIRGNQTIALTENVDYFLTYNAATRELRIRFSRDITDRSLPDNPALAGPGVYRFELNPDILRASDIAARLDGDGDGVANPGEIYSQDDFVGDPGDRLVPTSADLSDSLGRTITVDFRAPFSLDRVLDNNVTPDGLPDINTVFTVRGFLGDHPDTDPSLFQAIEDVDLYSITLQAGQILRLGALTGAAADALRFVSDADGNIIFGFDPEGPLLRLPGAPVFNDESSFSDNYLVKTTGTYIIAVANTFGTFNANGAAPFPDDGFNPNATGPYAFSVEVYDDGNSGFSAETDAGNGLIIRNAPALSEFAGPDGIFGTDDDLTVVFREDYSFRVEFNEQGVPIVVGSNNDNVVSSRDSSTGILTSSIQGSIGNANFAGVPNDVVPDLDVYHLNGRNPIQPGTRMRITLKLTEFGGDLGSRFLLEEGSFSFVGNAIFALFDTTLSTTIDDAQLLFAPTDFSPNGGPAGTILANNGVNSYGFDNNGDFFIEFVTPGDTAGTYAVYVQGAFNTDYAVEVVTFPGLTPLQRRAQNVLIELNGGTIDWLQAGGISTDLEGFDLISLGYVGTVTDGRTIEQFVLDNLIANLNAVYRDSGFDVRFSFNPADFEFQDYSTVFITTTNDPITDTFNPFSRFGFNIFDGDLGINPFAEALANPYGYSQRSDPLNTDPNDEAVVFIPSLALLGNVPSTQGLTIFSQSLSAAVGRRVGELLGLRANTNQFFGVPRDIMAANSVTNPPGLGNDYTIDSFGRRLSDPFDSVTRTAFYIGRQSTGSLLDKLLTTP